MKIDTEMFVDMAPIFHQLGEGLSKYRSTLAAEELSQQLLATARTFEKLPSGHFDFDDFASDRSVFIKNLTDLTMVVRAAGNPDKRDEPLLKTVGQVADRLEINEQCSTVASNLVRILVDLPSIPSDHK